jgi:hypothetical protein
MRAEFARTFRTIKLQCLAAFAVLCVVATAWLGRPVAAQVVAKTAPEQHKADLSNRVQQAAVPLLDRVRQLDGLKEELAARRLALQEASAAREQAKRAVEVAQIAVQEYEKGVYPAQLQAADGELVLAKAQLEVAKGQKESADQMREQHTISEREHSASVLGLQKSEIAVKLAMTKRVVLEKYSYNREMSQRRGAVHDAEDQLALRKEVLARANAKTQLLEKRIAGESLTAGERDGLAQLEEANGLVNHGEFDRAEGRINDAVKTLSAEAERRADGKAGAVLRQIREAVGGETKEKSAR